MITCYKDACDKYVASEVFYSNAADDAQAIDQDFVLINVYEDDKCSKLATDQAVMDAFINRRLVIKVRKRTTPTEWTDVVVARPNQVNDVPGLGFIITAPWVVI